MGFSMFSAQASPIAIDFGSSSVKLLQIGNGDSPSLVAAAELPIPDELRQDQAELLNFYAREIPRVLKQGKFRGKRVVSAIPSGQTLVQHMQIAALGGANIDDVVKGQLQVQMGCSPRSIVVRSLEVANVHRGGDAQKEIICFAVSRDTVMRYVNLLKQCRLEPVGMHTETMAMVRAFDHLNRRAEDTASTTLYVDLGWSGTLVAVGHGRNIRFARYIQIGGRNFDQAICEALNCSPEDAREYRMQMSNPISPVETSGSDEKVELSEGMAVIKQAMAQATAKATGKPVNAAATEERRQRQGPGRASLPDRS